MANAITYEEYRRSARRLDDLEGAAKDKLLSHKNFAALKTKIARYHDLVKGGKTALLAFELRAELERRHFGLGKSDHDILAAPAVRTALSRHMGVVCCALKMIAGTAKPGDHHNIRRSFSSASSIASMQPPQSEHSPSLSIENLESLDYTPLPLEERLRFFLESRRAFGHSALLLSGGAQMGIQHIGVVKALWEEGLLPNIFSGASAGALACAMVGCLTDDQLPRMWSQDEDLLVFFGHKQRPRSPTPPSTARRVCDRVLNLSQEAAMLAPPPLSVMIRTVLEMLPRVIQERSVFDWEVLAESIQEIIGDITFQEAYVRTNRVINIPVTSKRGNDWPRLLNHITAPHVVVWSAAVASCAIPGIFSSVQLRVKHPLTQQIETFEHNTGSFVDGSMEMDLPMERIKEQFNVNHFIVSQVNPHAQILLVGIEESTGLLARTLAFLRHNLHTSLSNLAEFGMTSSVFRPLGVTLSELVLQPYHGDITICVSTRPKDLTQLLRNPTRDQFNEQIKRGERNCWSHLETIRLHCAVEFELDRCLSDIRNEIVDSDEGDGPRLSSSARNLSYLAISALDQTGTGPNSPRHPTYSGVSNGF